MRLDCRHILLQEDVLRLQVAMNDASLVQEAQSVQQLLGKHPHECCTKPSKLILLDQLVQVHTEKLEYQAQMLLVNEGVFQPQKMVIIVLVELAIQLREVSSGIKSQKPHVPDQGPRLPSCSG